MDPSDFPWYSFLFGNLMSFSKLIQEYCGASIIMWYQLAHMLLGSPYLRDTQDIYNYGDLFFEFKTAVSFVADVNIQVGLLFDLAKDARHVLIPTNSNFTFRMMKRTKLSLYHDDPSTARAAGVNVTSSHFDVLSYVRGGRNREFVLMNTNICSYLGLYDLPTLNLYTEDEETQVVLELVFEDHVQSLIKVAFANETDISMLALPPVKPSKIISSGGISISSVPYPISPSAYRFDPLQHEEYTDPTKMMRHEDVQSVLLYLSLFHRSAVRTIITPRIIINFLPFIEHILRATIVSNYNIGLVKPIPSTPWTVALFYFTALPVLSGYQPLIDAFYTYHHHRFHLNLIWNESHLDDIVQALEWWIRSIETYDSTWEGLECNPLHNQINFNIYHAVCSSLFLNLVRSLFIGMLEPYICTYRIPVNRLDAIRQQFCIYDFDEFSPALDDDDASVHPLMLTTLSNNVFVTMVSEKATSLRARLSKVVTKVNCLIEDPAPGDDRVRAKLPMTFEYERIGPGCDTGIESDIAVISENTTVDFKQYMKFLVRSDITNNDVDLPNTSLHYMVFNNLALFCQSNRLNEFDFPRDPLDPMPQENKHFGELFDSLQYFMMLTHA